jgi:hypothetical protein
MNAIVRRIVSRFLIATLCYPCATMCMAHTFCITNLAQFNQALIDSARSGTYDAEPVFLYLAAGTYAGNFFVDRDAELYVVGGYNEDCSHLTTDASLTVLDGGHNGTVLTTFASQTIISNLTIQNGTSTDTSAGLRINDYNDIFIGFDGPVSLGNLIVRNNHAQQGAGGIFAWGGHAFLYMADCLVYGNSSMNSAGGVALRSDATTTAIYDNTIADNTGGTGGLAIGSDNDADVSNNILWGNVGADLAVGGKIHLRYNDVGASSGSATSTIGDISSDPKFLDAQGANYHLATDSPARTLSPVLEGVDLDGNAHPTSGMQDIGAYYDNLFSDGFDSSAQTTK